MMGDRVRRDNARWGVRKIHAGGRVLWLGRWFRLESGRLSMPEYLALPRREQTTRGNEPSYDGSMDGKFALFYTYGDHHEGSKTHIYLHSVVGADWPGPQCVDGVFVWETFALEATA